MKKLLLALIVVLTFTNGSFAQKATTGKTPLIEIEFGRKSKDCGGFGICVFRVNIGIEEAVALVNAFANVKGLMDLKMSPQFYKDNIKSFPNGYFLIDEDFTIDLETSRAIGFSKEYTIKKGKYKVALDKSTNTYNCTF